MKKEVKTILIKAADNAPEWAESFLFENDIVVYYKIVEDGEMVRFMYKAGQVTSCVMKMPFVNFSLYHIGCPYFNVSDYKTKVAVKAEETKEQKTVASWNGVGEPPIGATVYVDFISNQGSSLYRGVLMYNSDQTVIIKGSGIEMVFAKNTDFYRVIIRP